MFSGLISFSGQLHERSGTRLSIAVPSELRARLATGDSVAVNGVCLTVAELTAQGFHADLLAATLRDTTLGELAHDSVLNLEPALRVGDSLGGHLVQGHVDGTTLLRSRAALPGGAWLYTFDLPDWLGDWIVPKGSICVDGVSLTVQELSAVTFSVELIPTTLALTSLGALEPPARVNLEADLIVKTVSHLLARRSAGL